MPWEKQFNPDEVLDRAMRAFWRKGYEATSMQDLLDCMGIQRGSFYATFHDKRSLFMMAIDRYEKQFVKWSEWIESEQSPKDAIAFVFDSILKDATVGTDYCGCFLVNTALELAPHDPEIGALVENGFARTEQFFWQMIRKGQADGTIRGDMNAKGTARVLVGLLAGLRVLSRGREKLDAARAIVAHAKKICE